LCIALEAVNDIANHALLDVHDGAHSEAEVRFKTRVHEQMFLLRLLDFSKERAEQSITGVRGSCLEVLQAACGTKSFDVAGSVAALKDSVTALSDWLDAESTLKLWIPTLDSEVKVSVPRSDLLFILGNHVKHNLARLSSVSKVVARVLTTHGIPVTPEQVPLALDDIREHLQENYFNYYGTWLTELINNVRWGIQDYLQPEYRQSFTPDPDGGLKYGFQFPAQVSDSVAREWYWRLMNHIRSRPFIKRFVVSAYLKRACSIEP
jgi:hypothetical protein